MIAILGQFFLNPWFVVGGLAAGIPIIIHLIHKRQAQKVFFGTLRFLKLSNQRTSRRRKVEDLFLLLLRCLALMLLTLALMKPFIKSGGFGTGGKSRAVVILDNSYSMATREEKTSRFEVAKEMAATILEVMSKGDFVGLVPGFPTKSQPDMPLEENLQKISREIMRYGLTQGRAELSGCLARAEAMLKDIAAANMEIYILSDLQRNSWSPLQKPAMKKLPNIILVNCGSGTPRNLALTNVAIRGKSMVKSVPVMIEGKIKSYSPQPETPLVTLYIDGEKKAQRSAQVSPGAESTVLFTYVFDKAGIHTGRLALEPDALPLDNERHFKCEIKDKIEVLIVQDMRSEVSFLDESFFLARALDPYTALGGQIEAVIEPTVVRLAEVTPQLLARYPVVFLVNVRNFRSQEVSMFKQYLFDGGGIILFAGSRVTARNYNPILRDPSDKLGGLLPVTMEEDKDGFVDRTTFKRLAEIDFKHPSLLPFKGSQVFSQVKVYKTVSIKIPGDSPARPILTLETGIPFLLENTYGKGKIFFFTTSANVEWTNLPITKLFLPLIHQLVYYLTQKTDVKGDYLLGAPVRLSFDTNDQLTVELIHPDGKRVALDTKPTPERNSVLVEDIERVGTYTYSVPGKQGFDGAFAVNPDTRESDLTPISADELRRLLPERKLYFVNDPKDLKATVKRLREGVELWDYFFYAVLALILFECFFANRVMPSAGMAQQSRPAITMIRR